MFDVIKTILEDIQKRTGVLGAGMSPAAKKADTDQSDKEIIATRQKKMTALAGHQPEPNRGAGSDRKPSTPKAHTTGPTNEGELVEAREKHTHKGHCQACGRLQAHESTGGVAKHGYTTEGGYFSGTCMGSGHKPLEHSHELCDRIQHDLHNDAKSHEKQVHDAKAGHTNPQIHSHTEYKKNEHGNRIAHHVHVPYKEAGHEIKESWHNRMLNRAHMSRSHAQMLAGLKKQIHGQPLVSAQHQAEVRKKASGERKAKTDHKDHLRSLAHQYDKHVNALQDHFLKIPHEHRTEAQSKVYYAPQFHHWSEKHSTAARKEFPAAKETIDAIDHLVAQRKAMTKKEEVQMNDFEFKQLEEGIKAKMSPQDAHDFLTQHDAHHDFHKLPSETAMAIRDKSYEVGFHHDPKRANGSRSRYFHAALVRHARRGAVKEETVSEAAHMKLKPEHYDALKTAVHRVLDEHPHTASEYAKNGLSPTRFRWDALHASRVMHTQHSDGHSLSHHIYKYANDSHIDTALKHIVASHKSNVKEETVVEVTKKNKTPSRPSTAKEYAEYRKRYWDAHNRLNNPGNASDARLKELGLKEDRNNEYSAHSQLSSSRSNRKAGHYLMKHGSPMHSEPHKDSAAALHAYKSLGDSKGVSIHQVKEDLEEVPGVVKTLSELKKSTLKSYLDKASERHAGHTALAMIHPAHGAAHRHYAKSAAKREKGIPRASSRLNANLYGLEHPHIKEGAEEHAKFADHTKNPYHKVLAQHGFVHHSTTHKQNPLAPKQDGTYDHTQHVYTHPSHGKSHVTITQYHNPGRGHGGKYVPHNFIHRHEQENGLIAPAIGENKNQLHRSLSREYGVPKGVKAPKLMSWERGPLHPNYKMNEAAKFEYQDARGVTHKGHMEKYLDHGGTDHTAFMRNEKGELHLVSGSRLKAMKVVKEDAPAMSSGGAGDPGHVQNATDNHASQMGRRKDALKAMLRRKKPMGESQVPNLAGHIPPEFDDVELGVVSPEQLEKNRAIAKAKLVKKVGPGGVDESADQYSHHHSRASWKRVATQHGYAISNEPNGKGLIANHPVHGYHVGSYNHKGQNGWISKPHPDWAKNESVVNESDYDWNGKGLHIRNDHATSYINHYNKYLKTNPGRQAHQKARQMAYNHIERKHGLEARQALEKYHADNTAPSSKNTGIKISKESVEVIDEAIKNSHRFMIKAEHRSHYPEYMHHPLVAQSQAYTLPGHDQRIDVSPAHLKHIAHPKNEHGVSKYWHSVPVHHIERSKIHESVEVNELNKKTLTSYLGKAHKQLLKAPSHGEFAKGSWGAAKWTLGGRKFANRNKGIDRAIVRLTEPGLKVSPKK